MDQLRKGYAAQISRKRKVREEEPFRGNISSSSNKPASVSNTTSSKPTSTDPVSSNRLLAGYMAYEFLTKGTLLGQRFDPARSEAAPVSEAASPKQKASGSGSGSVGSEAEPSVKKMSPSAKESYAEVAALLKKEGAHIPGIVNPTQLARWIQM